MSDKILHCAAALMFLTATASAQTSEITGSFNRDKVILPSSQYTPGEPYTASVWVFNEGVRYSDQYYNHIWAVPAADATGRQWYDPEYAEEDADGWLTARAPFSSDEYYGGQKSYRWVTSDIMGEIYLRRTFTLTSLPEGFVFLACGHDDAPSEWYINGELVHSVSDGWNNDEYIMLTDEQKALIKTDGTPNLLAVHVHQNWGGAFADCGLYGADMSITTKLLPTVDSGAWPCNFYILNYNSDIALAEAADWAAETEDESDWMTGVGPFSNDNNMFYITEWPSQVRPILVRRHFNLDAETINALDESTLMLLCSYDENPKVYLNGTLIWSASGWNDNNYAVQMLGDEQKALLHEGDNVVAVSLMQGGGGGHIDYGLQLTRPYSAGIFFPAMETTKMPDSRIFNLHGQFLGTDLDRLPRGIYIVGGKKVIK